MHVPMPAKRLLARRRCIKELHRLAVSLDSIYTGTPAHMETPDGPLTDEIGIDELLDEMYMIQERFVGGLSFWPHIDVLALLHQITAEAQGISQTLPDGYPRTRRQLDVFIADVLESEPRCSRWYALAFNKPT
ncbi:hypothetical protein ACX80Z_14365 [Arthrobacter sp. TMT4-20]